MSQIMKSFTGLFLILLMGALSAGLLTVFLTVQRAQNVHAAMINEIEDSDFYPGVLRECYEQAESLDASLVITLYSESRGALLCESASQIPADTEDVSGARVVLEYPFQVAWFSLSGTRSLSGYAR